MFGSPMSKITPEAAARCTPHTLADQLAAYREAEARELARKSALLHKRSHDMDDIELAFEADATGAHKRGFE